MNKLMLTTDLVTGNGYSGKNWEYQIRDRNGNLWTNGGYETAAAARAAGRAAMREIRAAHAAAR